MNIGILSRKGDKASEQMAESVIKAFGPLELIDGGKLDGEARMFRLPGGVGSLGFISPVPAPW